MQLKTIRMPIFVPGKLYKINQLVFLASTDPGHEVIDLKESSVIMYLGTVPDRGFKKPVYSFLCPNGQIGILPQVEDNSLFGIARPEEVFKQII